MIGDHYQPAFISYTNLVQEILQNQPALQNEELRLKKCSLKGCKRTYYDYPFIEEMIDDSNTSIWRMCQEHRSNALLPTDAQNNKKSRTKNLEEEILNLEYFLNSDSTTNLDQLRDYFSDVLVHNFTGHESRDIISICEKYGWQSCAPSIISLIKSNIEHKQTACVTLLVWLVSTVNNNSTPVHVRLCKESAEIISKGVTDYPQINDPVEDKISTIVNLFQCMYILCMSLEMQSIVKYLCDKVDKTDYGGKEVLVVIAERLNTWMKNNIQPCQALVDLFDFAKKL